MTVPDSVKALVGHPIVAIDGEIGRVDAVFFDDQDWDMRYLVVNTSGGLSGRKVLVPPASIDRSGTSEAAVRLALTRKQVTDSPAADSDMPVSRQYEDASARYYGHSLDTPGELKDAEREAAQSHLRSSREVIGYAVHGADGLVGHVDDLLVDEATWKITALLVDAPEGKMRIAPQSVDTIDWKTREVRLEER